MCRWRNIIKQLLPCIFMLVSSGIPAQEETLIRAQQLLAAKKPELAKLAIDSAILHPETKNDFMSWTTRAFIYYEIYKRSDKQKLNSELRDTIVSSLKISQSLNPDSSYLDNNKKLIASLANAYYNMGKSLLQDSVDAERSVIAYNRYKDLHKLGEPAANLKTKDVEYYLAVGSVYSDIFIRDNKNSKAEETAKLALLKVMELQPDNPNALINMGLMYYNQAANLSQSLKYDDDFEKIDFVQENMVKLAKQSEQFIARVYNTDNKNPKAVEALYYIYRMLNEFQKSEEFKARCKAMGIDVSQVSTTTAEPQQSPR